MGEQILWHRPVGSHLPAPAFAFRSFHVRHLRHALGMGGAASGAPGAESPATQAGAVHTRSPAYAVVLGTLGPQSHGEIRCRCRRRLPGPAPGDVVRRADPDTDPDPLDAASASRALHESL